MFDDKKEKYLAVVNDEGQYSIWAHSLSIPAGWFREFGPASYDECLEYIDKTWTDMRPRSIRDSISS